MICSFGLSKTQSWVSILPDQELSSPDGPPGSLRSHGPGGVVPFASRPFIRATDPGEMAEALWRNYRVGSARFEDTEAPFLALANGVRLEGVRFHYCRYDTPAQISFVAMGGYRQVFVLSGSSEFTLGGTKMALGPESTGLIPPGSDFDAAYSQGYAHIIAEFDEGALVRKAERLTGRDFAGLPDLPLGRALPAGRFWKTRGLVDNLADQFANGADEAALPITELAQALASAFLIDHLEGHPGLPSLSAKAAGRPAADLLEDYIRENWSRPLTVEEIAAACGVSVRSVFARFRETLGTSPMAYLRTLRLDEARRRLREGEPGVAVMDVALACGFASFGHFAQRYRDRFGELPSETATRSR